jgi:hypothetical protein
MKTSSRRMIFMVLLFLLLQTPSVAQNLTEPENLWQKLCYLALGSNCATGLAIKMARVTEKSGGSDRSSLYLVNTSTGNISKWQTEGSSVKQPTFCSSTNELFYRRGNAVYRESIQIEKTSVVKLVGPYKIGGVEIINLYACTQDENGSNILWVEDVDNKIRHLRIEESNHEIINLSLDSQLAKVPLRELAEKLGLLRGMREDGYQVWVRNHKLLGQIPSESSLSYIVKSAPSPSLQFSGSPAWMGASDYLFITVED